MFNNYPKHINCKFETSISDNLTSFYPVCLTKGTFLGTMVRFLKATEAENEANLYCTRGQWPPGWNVPDTTWSRPRTRLRPSWIPLSTQSPTHLAATMQWLSSTITTKTLICFRLVCFGFFPVKHLRVIWQIGRSSETPIDFVVMDTIPGDKTAEMKVSQSTISRFACRILCERNNPKVARIYAAGFDSSRNIFLGVSFFGKY